MNILLLGQSNAARWFKGRALGSRSFLDSFASAGAPVSLINGAMKGSSLLPVRDGNWLDTSPTSLYANAIHLAKAAGKIDGVIWIQGESDAKHGIGSPDYQSGLNTLFGRIRSDLGDVPIYMQPLALPKYSNTGVQQAQFSYKDPLTHLVQPNIDKITSKDGTHYTQRSYEHIAKKFANQMMRDLLTAGLPTGV